MDPVDRSPTLSRLFERSAHSGRSFVVVDDPTGDKAVSVSHADLLTDGAARVAALVERGLTPGTRVAVIADTSLDFLAQCVWVWAAGGATVFLGGRAQLPEEEWARTSLVRMEMTGAKLLLAPQRYSSLFGSRVPVVDPADVESGSPRSVAHDPDLTAAVFFSTGTTALPKAIAFTHRQIYTQLQLRRDATSARPDAAHRLLWWGPMYTSVAVHRVLIHSLIEGLDVVLLHPRHVMRDASVWLAEISKRRATHSGGPTFGYELAAAALQRAAPGAFDLSCWQEVTATGDAAAAAILERFFRAAEPFGLRREGFICTYASTECSVVTTGRTGRGLSVDRIDPVATAEGHADPAGDNGLPIVSTGRPVKGVRVRIGPPGTPEVPERTVGEIFVLSPGQFQGYENDPEATKAAFVDGWIRTGDRGYVADGELYVLGRADDVLVVRGRNVDATDLETIAAEALGRDDVTACALAVKEGAEDRVVVLVAVPSEAPDLDDAALRRVRSEVWRKRGVVVHETVPVTSEELPRSAGKLQRPEVRARYLRSRSSAASGDSA
jgi:acyl-CoA synthetase (AMP-forming)/AMP-acid ligase II